MWGYRGLGSVERNWRESVVAACKTIKLHFIDDCHCYCWFHLPCVIGWDGVLRDIEMAARDLVCWARGYHTPKPFDRFPATSSCTMCGLVSKTVS